MVAGAYDFQGSDSGLIRIDTTDISDAHNLAATIYLRNDGGAVTLTAVGFATINTNQLTPGWLVQPNDFLDPIPVLNFIREPDSTRSKSTRRCLSVTISAFQ